MRPILTLPGRLLLTTSLLLFFQILNASAQSELPLADEIGKWSEPQIRYMGNANSPKIKVRTKVIKHFGTTGVIDVEITNLSGQNISNYCGLKVTRGDLNDNTIHINNAYSIKSLKPDYYLTFRMELRECHPKGGRKMNDLEKIIACQPRLLFPGN
jgi:hypothetical protein